MKAWTGGDIIKRLNHNGEGPADYLFKFVEGLGEPDRDLVAGQASLRPHAVPLSVAPAPRSPATAGPPLRRRPHLA